MEKMSGLELEIMQCVWDMNGTASPADVVRLLGEKHEQKWSLQMVCTYMMRMAGKNYLYYEKKGRQAIYTAMVSESAYFDVVSADYSKSWGKGVLKRMAVSLVKQNRISDSEIQDLKAYLDELAN